MTYQATETLPRWNQHSVSLGVSGTEAEATEGLWGDLNTEDLETPFLLM